VKNLFAWFVAAAGGASLWVGANLTEGSQEPWDAERYWTTYLPFAIVLCFVLGAIFPERPWRWPLAVMLVQLPVMMAFTGEVGALLPLGLALLTFLSLPGILVAWLGAAARRWAEARSAG